MDSKIIVVKTTSCNLGWGIYGFCEKTDWEDIELFYENGDRIGAICLQTKRHLRTALDELKRDPDEVEFIIAIEKYLVDSKCHYWYYYDEDRNDKDFYEVPYDAPVNTHGIKPRFMDIWHPDEGIDLDTIETGVKAFANKFLGINDVLVQIEDIESFEESLQSFNENQKLFYGEKPIEVVFSNELVKELSVSWKKNEKEVLRILNKVS